MLMNSDDAWDKAKEVVIDMKNTLEEVERDLGNAKNMEEAKDICRKIGTKAQILLNELPDPNKIDY